MTDFTLQIAGCTVDVTTLHHGTARYCKDYLVEKVGPADFSVATTQADIDYERLCVRRTEEAEGLAPRQVSDSFLEITAVQRKIAEELFSHQTILHHGSVVAVDGQAYLFTAKSGTGKSTHTRLWREVFGERAVMVNDDKPFLKITENGVIAYGTPWNGKHRLGCNIAVPLKAICILERGEINHIQQIPPKNALSMIIQQTSRPMNGAQMLKYMDLIDGLSRKVAFYRMGCTISTDAAQLAYETMSKG